MRHAHWLIALAWVGCATTEREATMVKARQLLESAPVRTGDLRFRCEPSDAAVSVDGVERGQCSDFSSLNGLRVGTGMHRVDIKKEGFFSYSTYYELDGTHAEMAVQLSPLGNVEGATP